MSLLRPSCAAGRRLCAWPSRTEATTTPSLSPILALLRPPAASRPPGRGLSHAPRLAAPVVDPPPSPAAGKQQQQQQQQAQKQAARTVRIGPLPGGRASDDVIRRIFGRRLSPAEGNNVLRILHHRRTAGSLADYGVDQLGSQYAHVDRALALRGLNWLRDRYPVDEAVAAEQWAEREANRIAYELWLADPETESKYKHPARAFREQMQREEAERQQHARDDQKIGILHVGRSQFERNIEEKRHARLAEATRNAELKEQRERDMDAQLATGEWVKTPSGKQLMKPHQTTYVDVFGNEQVSRRSEERAKYEQRAVSGFKDPEEMLSKTTLSQRLYPMTAFVLFVSLLSWAFAHYYTPPAPEYRLFPDLSPTTATMAALLGANLVVAIAWRIMPLWPLMTRYFMHVPGYPRAAQSVLNVFSHVQYEHLLANMMMLCLVGPVCLDLVGRGIFMGTYISAGAVGTLASLYWANLGRGSITAHSVGASAAIWGIAALYCLLTDAETIQIPFVKDLQVSFWPKMLFAAFVALEIHNALRGKRATMDHASHFGGMLVGIGTAGYLRYTGFPHTIRSAQTGVAQEEKTVDVGARASEAVGEVKDGVKRIVK
ncbi:Rhomboid protease [Ascochyta rabiei]|uniref:Rhomboid protease n=1 Tax=Didymella rabiei TaxID=5454 RepID=UPI0022023619|nr:Rhomboid protease [Ascochyta rabiei]UPX11007.1 Rhomboid protease [Ascochyta rabiei]